MLNLIKSSRQKMFYTTHYAVYCYMSPLISLIYFIKSYAREAQLRGIFRRYTSDMKLFKETASGFKPSLIFAKNSILDIFAGSRIRLCIYWEVLSYRENHEKIVRKHEEIVLQYLICNYHPVCSTDNFISPIFRLHL